MDSCEREEKGRDLASMVANFFDRNPHARALPRAGFVEGFARFLLEDPEREPDEDEEAEALLLVPGEYALYHRGASPMTGRPTRHRRRRRASQP